MKVERTKNAARNIRAGFILKLYQVLMPFVMRTVLLYTLGVEYLGLGSLFASIIRVLNLAELGVGSAMVYSMYRPIAEDNGDEICALMRLYRVYYRLIGLIVLALGLVLMPFVPRLIKGSVPADVSVYVLYLLNLAFCVPELPSGCPPAGGCRELDPVCRKPCAGGPADRCTGCFL